MEFLIGRHMQNALQNMRIDTPYSEALKAIGYQLETLYEEEVSFMVFNTSMTQRWETEDWDAWRLAFWTRWPAWRYLLGGMVSDIITEFFNRKLLMDFRWKFRITG